MIADDATLVDSPLIDTRLPTREVAITSLPVTAVIHPDPRPLAVRNSSLRTVTAVLDLAAIEYFSVPGFNDRGSTIAVLEDDRARVKRAIMEGFSRAPRITQLYPSPKTANGGITSDDPRARPLLDDGAVLRLHWITTDKSGSLIFGPSYGVEIEYWSAVQWSEGVHTFSDMGEDVRTSRLTSPRPNRVARQISRDSERFAVDALSTTRIAGTSPRPSFDVTARSDLSHLMPDEARFPIDVVYTWVDSADASWSKQRARYRPDTETSAESASTSRFVSRDELRFSLRSLYANAPWVNRVFIVTAGQRPEWLLDHPSITVVDHSEIFADPSVLPVFNSHAIEANLHRIPGLAEHFLYFNDDMFIGRPIPPNVFFEPNGVTKFFPSPSRVSFLPPSPFDTPVDAATRNVRGLIERDFGVSISQVMEHAPYPLRKSVLEEMASRYEVEFRRTSRARFRSRADLNIVSNFAHHYGYQTCRATPASISFTYIGLSVRDLKVRLERLLARRDRDAFCLNDTFTHEDEIEAQLELVIPFLERYFPVPSPWER